MDWSAVHTPSVYMELRQWQAGIGAFVGLSALLGGAFLNAYLARRRDDRIREETEERDDRLRDEDRRLVASAVAGVWVAVAKSLDSHRSMVQKIIKEKGSLADFQIRWGLIKTPDIDAITGHRR